MPTRRKVLELAATAAAGAVVAPALCGCLGPTTSRSSADRRRARLGPSTATPALVLRRSEDRGHFDHGWLDTRHTFSFARYQDPAHMGFRALRVINEDFIVPSQGFPTHPHREMEILTWILSGALEHRDSMGNGSVIRRGDSQRMSAGLGLTHSEYNASRAERVHLLQIWLLPDHSGGSPAYAQRQFPETDRRERAVLLASRSGEAASITIGTDVRLWSLDLARGQRLEHGIAAGRHAWLQVARGAVRLGRERLRQGDGASTAGEVELALEADEASEVLLFDLA